MTTNDESKPDDETHPLFLPDVPLVMPKGELPVVREGTIGGIPAYKADPPKRSCGCPDAGHVCLHTPIDDVDYSGFEWLGISRETK